jgi:uncharacterized protein YwgA
MNSISSNGKLNALDIILLLLANGKTAGRTMMQEQVFLAYKEVLRDYSQDLLYYPDEFGPFSKLVEDSLRYLRNQGLIKVLNRGEGHQTYLLTEEGKSKAEEISRKLPDQMINTLKNQKISWDEWDTKGILRYICRKYPEYATNIVLPELRWD